MKYLLMIYSNPASWGHPTFLRTAEFLDMTDDERAGLTQEFETLLTEISESGELVGAQALADPITSRTVRVRDGGMLVTDGPFVEAKEHMAGYFIVDCATPERAEQIASRFPDARFAGVEVRPLMDGTAEDL
ncbi:YciI family protein [Monashia sp. NPDC004114]